MSEVLRCTFRRGLKNTLEFSSSPRGAAVMAFCWWKTQRLSPTISFLEDLGALCVLERADDGVPLTISVTDDKCQKSWREQIHYDTSGVRRVNVDSYKHAGCPQIPYPITSSILYGRQCRDPNNHKPPELGSPHGIIPTSPDFQTAAVLESQRFI